MFLTLCKNDTESANNCQPSPACDANCHVHSRLSRRSFHFQHLVHTSEFGTTSAVEPSGAYGNTSSKAGGLYPPRGAVRLRFDRNHLGDGAPAAPDGKAGSR